MASLVKEPSLSTVDSLDGLDAIVCLVPEDQRPLEGGAGYVDWRLCGALSRALSSGFFSGQPGEKLLLPSEQRLAAPLVFAVGLGVAKSVTTLGLEHAVTTAVGMLEKARVQHVAVAVPTLPQVDANAVGTVLARSLVKPWKEGRVVVIAALAIEASLKA